MRSVRQKWTGDWLSDTEMEELLVYRMGSIGRRPLKYLVLPSNAAYKIMFWHLYCRRWLLSRG